jgi:hypothetical protein
MPTEVLICVPVLIDCAKKSVKLTTPDGKELEFLTESVVTAKGVANRVKVNQMDVIQGSKVPVVNEFLNVFPEELPGTRYLGLMICLINSVVRVCSLRLIFDRDIIS